jgi:hypothetical protein
LACLLELFEYSVEIIYRSHLEITSIVYTSFPSIPSDHPTLFTRLANGRWWEGSSEVSGRFSNCTPSRKIRLRFSGRKHTSLAF